jgi:hypothetical protein
LIEAIQPSGELQLLEHGRGHERRLRDVRDEIAGLSSPFFITQR